MPSIQKLYDKYSNHPEVAFVMVSNESPDIIRAFKERKGYTFPVFSSQTQTPPAFFTRSIPTTFLLDKEGNIVMKEAGAMNWGGKKMENMINGVLEK
jgi:peroxiredoxin